MPAFGKREFGFQQQVCFVRGERLPDARRKYAEHLRSGFPRCGWILRAPIQPLPDFFRIIFLNQNLRPRLIQFPVAMKRTKRAVLQLHDPMRNDPRAAFQIFLQRLHFRPRKFAARTFRHHPIFNLDHALALFFERGQMRRKQRGDLRVVGDVLVERLAVRAKFKMRAAFMRAKYIDDN